MSGDGGSSGRFDLPSGRGFGLDTSTADLGGGGGGAFAAVSSVRVAQLTRRHGLPCWYEPQMGSELGKGMVSGRWKRRINMQRRRCRCAPLHPVMCMLRSRSSSTKLPLRAAPAMHESLCSCDLRVRDYCASPRRLSPGAMSKCHNLVFRHVCRIADWFVPLSSRFRRTGGCSHRVQRKVGTASTAYINPPTPNMSVLFTALRRGAVEGESSFPDWFAYLADAQLPRPRAARACSPPRRSWPSPRAR